MRRRPVAITALAFALILFAAWLARFRVANAFVDSKLAAAQVPASYQITKIGPFLERMENVRLGDPAAPDLVARRIEVSIGYGFSGPVVRGVDVDGVRLRGSYDANGLHLGTLDRLLPKSSGKAGLPDLRLSIRDTEVALLTPAGALSIAMVGDGNPARRFSGDARLAALSLSAGGCTARDVAAVLKIGISGGKPDTEGPVRMSALACPEQRVALGQGVAQIALSSDKSFERLSLDANLAGFGGRAQGIAFAGVDGAISGSRSESGLGAAAKLKLRAASMPDYTEAVAAHADIAAGTPLDPVVHQAIASFAALLHGADAEADFNITRNIGQPLDVRLHRVSLAGAGGMRLIATEQGGISWTGAGLRTDADIVTSGGGLPALTIRLRQAAAGSPLSGVATLQPYRVRNAQLAATPVRFRWGGKRADFETIVTIDGPIGAGFVRGLAVPGKGYVTSAGAFAAGSGCQTVAFRALRLTSFTFDAARVPVCGQPIVARAAGGALRIDGKTGPIRVIGHTADGAPVALGATQVRVTQGGFAAQNLTATLGQATHLAVATLDGTVRNGRIGGRLAGAGGAIGNVPLDISDANGGWMLAGSALKLTGNLRVSDAVTAAPRFNPLSTDNALLALNGGVITASATLREPVTHAEVATVTLEHSLSSGTGHALLGVPGITFAPKGLQPERLTPLTLGVIANVAGTIAGHGRIDWGPKGVASSGDFGTDRVDLAAAFGPVTGIKGQLHFTDLLGLVSAPGQEATIAEVNPGVSVTNGVVHYQLIGGNRVRVEDANWPFAGGDLSLDPSTLDFGAEAERHLTFRIKGLDAAAFVQQLEFPNISATGTFDGLLPMIFDQTGGRIEGGSIVARKTGGTLAYVGELSNAQLGTMGKLAFDALKAIRYSSLDISLDGRLDGEMVSRMRFTGVREATPEQSLVTRLIRNLPFRFNIGIRAPFRGLVGSARAYIDPRLLLNQVQPPAKATQPEPPIQTPASGDTP
jgi:translocation and assembly module TamB